MRLSRLLAPAVLTLALTPGCGEPVEESSSTTTAAEETTTSTSAPATTTTVEALTARSVLRMDGIGPVRMGMTLAEASAAVGRPVEIDENYLLNGEESVCGFASTPLDPRSPAKVAFMVGRDTPAEDWRIVRTDIDEDLPTTTEKGIKVGSTEAEVKAAYPAVTISPHPYTGPVGHYLTVDPDGNGGWLLIFETDGTKVLTFRSGQEEPVQYIEGCA